MAGSVGLPRAPEAGDLTYDRYLKVDELTALQSPASDPEHHDEMLFIIIHQSYELWFKLVLHELEKAIEHMDKGEVLRARHFIQRVVEVFKIFVSKIHVLETMAPAEFLQFRSMLQPASGFQSVQFREMEFKLGLKETAYLRFFEAAPKRQRRLAQRLQERDVHMAFCDLLRSRGADLPEGLPRAAVAADDATCDLVARALIPYYEDANKNLAMYLLAESLLDLDEQLSLWREHHVRVVERIIGSKRGTGGSSGVDYLKRTTSRQAFPALWAVRTLLGE